VSRDFNESEKRMGNLRISRSLQEGESANPGKSLMKDVESRTTGNGDLSNFAAKWKKKKKVIKRTPDERKEDLRKSEKKIQETNQ